MNLIAIHAVQTVFERKIVHQDGSDLDNILFNVITTICPFLANQLTSQSIQYKLNNCVTDFILKYQNFILFIFE